MLMRSHFTALQWKFSLIPSPELPDPNEYGWKWDETKEIFELVMTTNPPAPDSIMELISCGCKTGCQMGRCRKNFFVQNCVDAKIAKILIF